MPGLELLDDGTLRGGSLEDGGVDVLEKQQPLKSQHPGVVVGPDSQPTLSFTSGMLMSNVIGRFIDRRQEARVFQKAAKVVIIVLLITKAGWPRDSIYRKMTGSQCLVA